MKNYAKTRKSEKSTIFCLLKLKKTQGEMSVFNKIGKKIIEEKNIIEPLKM